MQKEAKENFMKALAIQESLAASPDSDLQDLRGLANMYLDTIDVLVSAKETARRGELISRGYEIFVRLRDQNPDRKQARVDVARALWYRATDVRSAGDNNASIRLFNEAIEMYEQLEREFPEDIRIKRALALSLKNVGGVYTLEHNNEEALRSFRRALAIDEESARHAPNDVLAQMDLSFTHASLGSALRNLNDREGAISAYSKALAIQEGLYSQDPKNHFVKMSVFRTGAMLAENLSGNKRFPEALTLYKRIFSLVSSTDPMSFNPLDRGQIAAARLRFGLFFEGRAGTLASNNRLADLVRARSELESSTAQFAQLEKEKVLDPSFVPVRKEAAESLARVRLTLEKLASR